jgi:hypothetical protein
MFQSTVTENFESWDKFLSCYYEPIRTALRLIPFVGEGGADDVAQSFFLKMYERDFLHNRPAITGRFRNWLYIAARRHAIDEWRKSRRPARLDAFKNPELVDPRSQRGEDAPLDSDEFYALSILHMAAERVRRHLVETGKSQHWMIFDELVLAPILPGRIPKTREALLAAFPGRGPDFLDNHVTTVKRVFRRILPALIPADPTDKLTPEERFRELLDILRASKKSRIWLAFLSDPLPESALSSGSSVELSARSRARGRADRTVPPEGLNDELRVLLAFWLELPLHEFLLDLDSAGPVVAESIRESSAARACRLRGPMPQRLNLQGLIDETHLRIPPEEMKIVLERLKSFAKRVHRSLRQRNQDGAEGDSARRESSMPPEIAQILYDVAGALALNHCGVRISGLSDDRFRKNITWALHQPWLDATLRPTFVRALKQLESQRDF